MLERLNLFIQSSRISYNKFEESIGASRGTISRAIRQKNNIGSNLIVNILRNYPTLSAEWLLRGEGAMLLFDEQNGASEKDIRATVNPELSREIVEGGGFSALMEKFVLDAWDKQHGAELRTLKQTMEIMFRERLTQQQNAQKETRKKREKENS